MRVVKYFAIGSSGGLQLERLCGFRLFPRRHIAIVDGSQGREICTCGEFGGNLLLLWNIKA